MTCQVRKLFPDPAPLPFHRTVSILNSPVSRKVILASSSRYRRNLLERLRIPFTCISPDVNESLLPNEQPSAQAQRLAGLKADRIARDQPEAIVIGSDQTMELDGETLGKPGSVENLADMIRKMSGRVFHLHTAMCVVHPQPDRRMESSRRYEGRIRQLTDSEIKRYVMRENATDCTGGMKLEGMGIALLEEFRGDDPTGAIGLPLVTLARTLESMGVKPGNASP